MKRCAAVLFLFICFAAEAQQSGVRLKQMEFHNQSITDILLALGSATGLSIVPDETVSGTASFYFSEGDFEQSLELFLSTYKLYYTRSGDVFYVSRVALNYDKGHNLVTLKADEVDVQFLVRALSKALNKTVLFDSLPRATITVNIEALSPDTVLEILMKRFPDYHVESDAAYYYLKKAPAAAGGPAGAGPQKPAITRDGDLYSLSLDKGKFLDTLTQLFSAAGKEYSLLTRTDSPLENLYFSGRSFDELLRLLLEQGNADFVQSGGLYYIFEMQRKDVLKKLMQTIVVPLKYVSAQDVTTLLPPDFASGSQVRVDRSTNSVLLTGSDEAIGPIRDFLAQIDRPLEGRSYHRFEPKYIKAKDLAALLPAKLATTQPSLLPDGSAFVMLLPDDSVDAVNAFIALVDRRTEGYPVRLRYIKSDELLKNLPPSVSKDDVVDSGLPSMIFFIGSEEKRAAFMREVQLIDRPKPQIRYQLLVIQYDQSENLSWTKSATIGSAGGASSNAFSGSMSSLLSLNFDVVSQFGALFALQLSAELDENRAHVFADTTLSSLSGQEAKFQNTNTFRYQQIEINTTTGIQQYTGVTATITSGLIVSINGWVSGDGMITMTVNATISKQGDSSSTSTSSSSSTTSLPSTSEKVVTTQLRTPSGKPVVIGGLIQEDKATTIQKVPVLGDIPLLGLLFRNKTVTNQSTEMVVYIVPHLSYEDEPDSEGLGARLDAYYDSYVKGFVK